MEAIVFTFCTINFFSYIDMVHTYFTLCQNISQSDLNLCDFLQLNFLLLHHLGIFVRVFTTSDDCRLSFTHSLKLYLNDNL